jgi:hypothetical protein
LSFTAPVIGGYLQRSASFRQEGVEHGHNKACLADLTSARSFKLTDSLSIETDANHEQNWLPIDLTYWNGADLTVHQHVRNAIR